jgi:hypothetical protein
MHHHRCLCPCHWKNDHFAVAEVWSHTHAASGCGLPKTKGKMVKKLEISLQHLKGLLLRPSMEKQQNGKVAISFHHTIGPYILSSYKYSLFVCYQI